MENRDGRGMETARADTDGYVPSVSEELEEQLQAVYAAKGWQLVAELAARLEERLIWGVVSGKI